MAKYTEQSDQFKADMALYDTYLRGTARRLLAVAREAMPDHWNQFSTDRIDSALATIDGAEQIPKGPTGLAGALPLTAAEVKQMQLVMRQLVGLMMANKSLLVKAVGVNVEGTPIE